MNRVALRDAAVCLSLSSLSLVAEWNDCLFARSAYLRYFYAVPGDITPELILAISVLTLATVTWTGAVLVRRSRVYALRCFASVALIAWTAAVICRLILFSATKIDGVAVAIGFLVHALTSSYSLVVIGLLYVGGTIFVARYLSKLSRCAVTVALMLLPCTVLISADLWVRLRATQRISERPSVQRATSHAHSRGRLVWVVFDEMDERFLSRGRPAGVAMANFDGLRSESLYATEASSNAWRTLEAIPSLLTGKAVSAATPMSDGSLSLQLEDGTRAGLGHGAANIFQSVRRAGMTVAVVGWYHPYARLFARDVTVAHSEEVYPGDVSIRWSHRVRHVGVGEATLFTIEKVLGFSEKTNPELPCLIREYKAAFANIRATALDMVGDRNYDMVFIHLPIPHPPGITGGSDTGGDYFDNLRLADVILGEIRERIQRAGLSDRTALLIMSDHPLRSFWRYTSFASTRTEHIIATAHAKRPVPFIVKLPGDSVPVLHSRPFQTFVSHDLILNVLAGNITTHSEAARWLSNAGARTQLSAKTSHSGTPGD